MKKELLKTIKWDLKTEPLTANNRIITEKKAIFRNDNNTLLGIVGKDYCPVTNSKFMEITETLTRSGEFELEGYDELNKGKTILSFLKNKNSNLKINDCLMKEYLIIGNSHDGTHPLYIGTGSSLTRCENQFYATLKVFRKKHDSPINMEDFKAETILSTYRKGKNKVYDTFNGMEKIKVDKQTIEHLIIEIHKMLDIDSSIAKKDYWGKSPSMNILRESIHHEMSDLGNNAFGLFNGVTWYTSHEMRNAGSHFGSLKGTSNSINHKAYRFCMNLKNVKKRSVEMQ